MSKLYSTVYKSIVRAVHDLVNDIETTMPNQPVRYWAWESRLDEDQMPREMLVGLNGLALHENLGQWIIQCSITLSTVDDANLLVEADVIDMIHDRFGEKKKISVLDPDDASVINELVCVDWQVLPMGQTQMRNYRSIGLELRRTGT